MNVAGCLVREDPHRAEGPGRDTPRDSSSEFPESVAPLVGTGPFSIALAARTGPVPLFFISKIMGLSGTELSPHGKSGLGCKGPPLGILGFCELLRGTAWRMFEPRAAGVRRVSPCPLKSETKSVKKSRGEGSPMRAYWITNGGGPEKDNPIVFPWKDKSRLSKKIFAGLRYGLGGSGGVPALLGGGTDIVLSAFHCDIIAPHLALFGLRGHYLPDGICL